jgi:predicted ferric reductase
MRHIHTHKAIYSHFKITGNEKNGTSCIFIHITLLNPIKVNYGSYFFICFKDVSSFQYHPLSLISEYNENLIFCAKDRGPNTWTNMLKRHDSSIEKNILMNKDIYLQGPYGHITIDYTKDKYKYIFSVAGGIGITPIISVLQDINYLYENKKNQSKIING